MPALRRSVIVVCALLLLAGCVSSPPSDSLPSGEQPGVLGVDPAPGQVSLTRPPVSRIVPTTVPAEVVVTVEDSSSVSIPGVDPVVPPGVLCGSLAGVEESLPLFAAPSVPGSVVSVSVSGVESADLAAVSAMLGVSFPAVVQVVSDGCVFEALQTGSDGFVHRVRLRAFLGPRVPGVSFEGAMASLASSMPAVDGVPSPVYRAELSSDSRLVRLVGPVVPVVQGVMASGLAAASQVWAVAVEGSDGSGILVSLEADVLAAPSGSSALWASRASQGWQGVESVLVAAASG